MQMQLAAACRGFLRKTIAAAVLIVACAAGAVSQAPPDTGAAPASSAQDLDKLVGPIALYPDDLVAIVLPASTNPLQLVQADRFLEKRKADPKLPVNEAWDDAVKSLLNYPEVVKLMSNDLDWTSALGEAVVADLGAVMDAIQSFRRRAQATGNLKTDDKQVIVVEKEVVKIVPSNPEVVYVPQYNPSSVVVYNTTPAYAYYPAPYPSYYYPYPPGAALATGMIWGAAIGFAWSGGHYDCDWGGSGNNNNININRETNIDRGDKTVNRGDRGDGRGDGNRVGQGQGGNRSSTAWKSDKKPGQVSSGATARPASARVGDARSGAAGGGANRAAATPANRGGGAGGGGLSGGQLSSPSNRGGGAGNASAARNTPSSLNTSSRDRSGGRGDAFGGYSSGRQTQMDSARGASSRGSNRGSFSGGGGGRSGGGGRGGGGRR